MTGDRARLYLADNLWLIAHHEYSGKSHVSDRALAFGLAGSLLGELVLHNKLTLSPRADLVLTTTEPPTEGLARKVHSLIAAEQARPRGVQVTQTRDWLVYLSEFAAGWTVRRLVHAGYVEKVHGRRALGLVRTTHHQVTDVNHAILPAVGIASRLTRRQPIPAFDVAFAGFALVTGLEKQLLLDVDTGGRTYLRRLLGGLPKSLGSLVAETESAIGDAVLSHRL